MRPLKQNRFPLPKRGADAGSVCALDFLQDAFVLRDILQGFVLRHVDCIIGGDGVTAETGAVAVSGR